MSKKYMYSFDGENYKGCFSIPSRAFKEAQAELKAAGETDGVFFVGLFKNGVPPAISANVVIEDLQQTAADSEYGGEYAEGWLDDVTEAHKAELYVLLTTAFVKWMLKHGYNPTWCRFIACDVYKLINGKPVLIEKGIR